MTDAVDWDALVQLAEQVRDNAYAPYSHFPVGAAGLTTSGHRVTGCNVENAAYGHTLCAECGLVSALHAQAVGHLVAVVVVDGVGQLISPCGRCRQLLLENSAEGAQIKLTSGVIPITALLPHPFDKSNLT
jgi:cytidine deaminase